MYLVVVAWLYVVIMMVVAEATSSTGTVLGAIVTFFLYGLVPVALVVYLMGGAHRRKRRLEREAAEEALRLQALASSEPDAGGHAAGAAEPGRVAPVREEP